MKRKNAGKKRGLYLIAAVVLLVGFGSAVAVYLAAGEDPGRVLGYEIVGGHVYPINPADSKIYRHDLEVYGGKWNVLADEFMGWFAGLWHGKSLAFTIACGTVLVSLGFFLAGRYAGPPGD